MVGLTVVREEGVHVLEHHHRQSRKLRHGISWACEDVPKAKGLAEEPAKKNCIASTEEVLTRPRG